jgi:hypothetical protein
LFDEPSLADANGGGTELFSMTDGTEVCRLRLELTLTPSMTFIFSGESLLTAPDAEGFDITTECGKPEADDDGSNVTTVVDRPVADDAGLDSTVAFD